MLYGNREIQDEILGQVRKFEQIHNKKVVFGAVVGSISKGMERFDSDYDTRFLYLDPCESGYVRWDKIEESIAEKDIHICYIPEQSDCYVNGVEYHARSHEFGMEDKGYFYDKIAFWELTSFVNFLKKPQLDNKFSIGLYHIVNWTFNSPYCWDPYGIKTKISAPLDEMFQKEYEIRYYSDYIMNCLRKGQRNLREYLYSCYYAVAIRYCIEKERFAPVFFPTLFLFCDDERIRIEIEDLKRRYYSTAEEMYQRNPLEYKRKMANTITTEKNDILDAYLVNTLDLVKRYVNQQSVMERCDYVEYIIKLIIDSLNVVAVRDVNERR